MTATEKDSSNKNDKNKSTFEEIIPAASKTKSDTLTLYFTIITGTLLPLAGGAAISWTSPVIPQLQSTDTNVNPLPEPATTLDISMLTALPIVSGLLGSLLAPLIADVLGRKMSLQITGLGMFLCDIGCAYSPSIILIIVTRCGLSIFYLGGISVLSMYITEVCENHNRGKFGSILPLMIPVGTLYSYILGPMFNVRDFTLLTAAPLIPFLILFFFIKESPVHLCSNGKKEECLKALKFLRNNKSFKELEADLDEIEKTVKSKQNAKNASILLLFKTRHARVGLVLAMMPMLIQYTCGSAIILAFLGPVLDGAEMSISGDTSAIIVGAVKVGCFFVVFFIMDRAGRRILMLISSIGCGISAFIVGVFFYVKDVDASLVKSVQLLPLIGIIAYIFLYSVGVGSLPWTILGEMFTSEYRAAAYSFLMTVLGFIVFLLTFAFPPLAELGMYYCMWLFSFNCIVGSIFIYIFLPETAGKSIAEIQEIISNYKSNNLKRAL